MLVFAAKSVSCAANQRKNAAKTRNPAASADFRTDWALYSWRFAFAQSKASRACPMSGFTLLSRANSMLVTKALHRMWWF